MSELELHIKEGTFVSEERNDDMTLYGVIDEYGALNVIKTRYYDLVKEFIINKYGVNVNNRLGKKVYLISDKYRLLALKTEYQEYIFIKTDYDTYRIENNVEYILNEYGLTEEGFIEKAKSYSRSLTL